MCINIYVNIMLFLFQPWTSPTTWTAQKSCPPKQGACGGGCREAEASEGRGKGKTVTESKVDEVVRRDTAVVEWSAGKREGELLGRIQKI